MAAFKSVLCLSFFLVTIAIGHATPLSGKQNAKKYVSLEDVMTSAKFAQEGLNATWVSDTELMYRIKGKEGVYVYDLTTKKSSIFISSEILSSLNTTIVELSPDRRFLMAKSDPLVGYRYSSTARYALYDLLKNETFLIAEHKRLQFCRFFGNNHSVAYVLNNDVYYRNGDNDSEDEIRLTYDGSPGIIYNGVPDWVYEEEVFGSGSAMWFSDSGSRIAIASFNDTDVDTTFFTLYGQPGSVEFQYPRPFALKYPKAGRPNPTVSLKVLELKGEQNATWTVLEAPVDVVTEDHILGTVTWASETEVAALWLNRRQNMSVLVICDSVKGKCRKEVTREEPAGWIEISTPHFSKNGSDSFLDILPVQQKSGSGEWFHLARYLNGFPQPLTKGLKTVISIVGWNQETNSIYYLGTLEREPWQRHLFVEGSKSECLSCGLTLPGGQLCRYASASFSTNSESFALTCQGDGPSHVVIYDAKSMDPIIVWQDNAPLRKTLEEYHLPLQKNLFVPVPGFEATVKLFLPPDLDQQDLKKTYPMVVNVYGGPGSARVIDKFIISYQTYMSTNRSMIYCFVEGRGTGLKGKDMLFSLNNNFGTVEIEDIINVTRQLTGMFPWIDKKNVGLWGWSYGGYATAMALTKDDSHIFKCGLSVAPVTNWIYYDSIYTERYMGLPTEEDNAVGYDEGDVIQRSHLLRDRNFALLHGNADDNVHYQNAMALVRALQEQDIQFELMSYPDEAHGLTGVTPHVYHTIDAFWTRCFSTDNSTFIIG